MTSPTSFRLTVGSGPAARDIAVAQRTGSAPGLFWLRFENQLGLAAIQAMRAERPLGLPLWVEVLSPKFPTFEAHYSFWNALVGELFERLAFAPFAFEAPTKVRVRQRHQSTLLPLSPPSSLPSMPCCRGRCGSTE